MAVYPEGPWAVDEMRKLQSEGRGFECGTAYTRRGSGDLYNGRGCGSLRGVQTAEPGKEKMCIEFILYIAGSLKGEKAAKAGLLPVLKGDPAQLE